MNLRWVEINLLKVADYYEKDEIDGRQNVLPAGIAKHGIFVPIIVNEHPERINIIVDGVQRVKEAKLQGHKKILAFYVNVAKEEEMQQAALLSLYVGSLSTCKLQAMLAESYDEILGINRSSEASIFDESFSNATWDFQTENGKKPKMSRVVLATPIEIKKQLEEINQRRKLNKSEWLPDYLKLIKQHAEEEDYAEYEILEGGLD